MDRHEGQVCRLTDAENGTGKNQEPSGAVELESPERSDVQGVTSGAERESQTRSEDVVHATSEEAHDGEAAVENAIGRVAELGILRTTSRGVSLPISCAPPGPSP